MAEAWPYSIEIPVRFRDCDPMRHVNNAALVTYLEIARTEYYMTRRGARSVDEVDFVLARVAIDFKSQARFGETIVVRTRPGTIGESSFTLEYELVAKGDGRLVAVAETVQVCYDYGKGQKKAIPEELRKALEAEGGKARERVDLSRVRYIEGGRPEDSERHDQIVGEAIEDRLRRNQEK